MFSVSYSFGISAAISNLISPLFSPSHTRLPSQSDFSDITGLDEVGLVKKN
jgi:hypothetical protein